MSKCEVLADINEVCDKEAVARVTYPSTSYLVCCEHLKDLERIAQLRVSML